MRPGSRTLGALIDELAAARPDADAIVFRGERLTFAALRDRSDAIARAFLAVGVRKDDRIDRKSTRLNSSHLVISYAVFCLKKKKRKSRSGRLSHHNNTHPAPHDSSRHGEFST